MSTELARTILETNPEALKILVKKLNDPPRGTFTRHKLNWNDKGVLPEDKAKENDLYDSWLRNLKAGDMVWYTHYAGWGSNYRRFTTVKNLTKTNMIRLTDDTLVDSDGHIKGGGGSYCYLQPYTEEYEAHKKRGKTVQKLNSMKFDHLTNDGLALVIQAIQQAEAMLPKLLEGE